MKKKLKLKDLKVNSFQTSYKAKIVGGAGQRVTVIDTDCQNDWSDSLCGPETEATGNCCAFEYS